MGFGQLSSEDFFNGDYIDSEVFKIRDKTVISPGMRANTWITKNVGDNNGNEWDIKVAYGDRRFDYLEKALNEDLTLTKALSISGFSGTIIPVYVDPAIIDITRKETPLVELIPRVGTRGKSVDFNRITALGTTGFQAEDAALSETNDTISRKSINVGFCYQVGRVTGPVQAAAAEYVDATNLEVMNKTKNLRYIEEQAIIIGNIVMSTGGSGDDSTSSPWNSNGFPGLIAQQEGTTTAAGITNLWTTSNNIVDAAGANLSLAHFRTAVENASNGGGKIKLAVTDLTTETILKGLMQEQQRMVNTTNFAWGIEAMSIDGIPVITSRFMSRTTRKREILLLDTDVLEMRVLQDIVFERLAKTNDSDKFYLKLYEVLVNKAPEFNALVQDYL